MIKRTGLFSHSRQHFAIWPHLVCWVAMFCGVVLVDVRVHADDPPGFVFKGANQNMNIELEGKLAGYKQGMLLVTRDDGVEVSVKPPADALGYDFQAPIEVGFLQRGMMVRFSGNFSKAGVPADPIEELTVFMPVSEKLAKKQSADFVPGIYPGDKKSNLPDGVSNYKVVGKLMGWDATGQIAVQAGRRPLRVQLGEEAKMNLRLNQLSLAQLGDAVTITGSYRLPDDTKVIAKMVSVTTDRVQTGSNSGSKAADPKAAERGKRD